MPQHLIDPVWVPLAWETVDPVVLVVAVVGAESIESVETIDSAAATARIEELLALLSLFGLLSASLKTTLVALGDVQEVIVLELEDVVVIVEAVKTTASTPATWVAVPLLVLLSAGLKGFGVALEDVDEVVVLKSATATTPKSRVAKELSALLGACLDCFRLSIWVWLYICQ